MARCRTTRWRGCPANTSTYSNSARRNVTSQKGIISFLSRPSCHPEGAFKRAWGPSPGRGYLGRCWCTSVSFRRLSSVGDVSDSPVRQGLPLTFLRFSYCLRLSLDSRPLRYSLISSRAFFRFACGFHVVDPSNHFTAYLGPHLASL